MHDNQVTQRVAKYFTLAEANAMLPLIKSIAADIGAIFRSVTGRRSDLHRLLRRGSRSAGSQYDDEMAESRADLQEEYERIWQFREELESLGVLLRQPEAGLIEFPTLMFGQEAFLCWQLGDEQIQHWRPADSSASNRQPLPSLENAN